MKIQWTKTALFDLNRLHDFVTPINPASAQKLLDLVIKATSRIQVHPRLGEQLFNFVPKELRRIVIGKYVMHYEIASEVILILRIWHTREHRTATPNTAE